MFYYEKSFLPTPELEPQISCFSRKHAATAPVKSLLLGLVGVR